MQRVLFVCLGNICRSPMAEAIFQNMVEKENLSGEISCDSAGTANYHVDDEPDHRTIKTLKKYNITTPHLGRQFKAIDFDRFEHIFAMDNANYHHIIALAKTDMDKKKVKFMREYDALKAGMEVPDPYYGGMNEFEEVYQMLTRCCGNALNDLKKLIIKA